MRNLLQFILKHYFFFLFILLEAIAFFYIVSDNSYHNNVYLNSSNQLIGNTNQSISFIREYLNLKQINEELANENIRLLQNSKLARIHHDDSMYFHPKTSEIQQFEFTKAKVVKNTTHLRNNLLMIDKGKNQDVKTDIGVICAKGVVGIIKESSSNFSSVISVLHKSFYVSAILQKSNKKGIYHWDGEDYQYGYLNDVPGPLEVEVGDSIVTGNDSYIFPKGILIGTVKDFKTDPSTGFFNIRVKHSVDYNTIYHVYLINNLFKEEQMKLEEKSNNDA